MNQKSSVIALYDENIIFNPCACLGPRQDELYCMCEMILRNLKTKEDYDWTQDEKDKFDAALSEIFKWKEKKKIAREEVK